MSEAGDHHYVPKFHLKQWTNGGLVECWMRVPVTGRLSRRSLAPAGTAYLPGLYALEHVGPERSQAFEREFSRLETEATGVHQKLITESPPSLSPEELYIWTLYLNAARLRVPHIVERIRSTVGARIAQDLSREIPEYDAAKTAGAAPTLYEWTRINAPARLANAGLKVLGGLITDERFILRLSNMIWRVRDVSSSPCKLMISDNPLRIVGDFYGPRPLISIPLSPTKVFFASEADDIIRKFEVLPPREIVERSNISTLTSARKYAYGVAPAEFVDRHFLRG